MKSDSSAAEIRFLLSVWDRERLVCVTHASILYHTRETSPSKEFMAKTKRRVKTNKCVLSSISGIFVYVPFPTSCSYPKQGENMLQVEEELQGE
jgi:hypothetical protein